MPDEVAGTNDVLKVCKDQAVHHLRCLFDWTLTDYPGAWFELRALTPDGGPNTTQASVFRCDDQGYLDGIEWAIRQNTEGLNLYVCTAPLPPNYPEYRHQEKGTMARNKDIEVCRWVYVDADSEAASQKLRDWLTEGNPEWDMSVLTGQVPSTRVHCYWKLSQAIHPKEFTATQKAIIARFDGDAAIHNPSRIMRLAGMISTPDSKKLTRGYEIEVTRLTVRSGDEHQGIEHDDLMELLVGPSPEKVSGLDLTNVHTNGTNPPSSPRGADGGNVELSGVSHEVLRTPLEPPSTPPTHLPTDGAVTTPDKDTGAGEAEPASIASVTPARTFPHETGSGRAPDQNSGAGRFRGIVDRAPMPSKYGTPPVDLETCFNAMLQGDHWHDNMLKIVAVMVNQGRSDAAIQQALAGATLDGWTHQQTWDEVQVAINGARSKWPQVAAADGSLHQPALRSAGDFDGPGGAGSGSGNSATPENPFAKQDAGFRLPPTSRELAGIGGYDPAQIPVRRWVIGRWLMAGQLSLILAPGGAGKSSFAYALALSVATGSSDLLGQHVFDPGNVLILGLEDTRLEAIRRLYGAMMYHKINPVSVADRIKTHNISDHETRPIILALEDRFSVQINDDAFDAIGDMLSMHKPKVVILDPFVSSHMVNENNNAQIDLVIKLLIQLCRDHQAALVAVHHTRKGAAEAGDVDSGRGASSLVNAARIAMTLRKMTEPEATGLNISDDDRRDFFRVDVGKSNMGQIGTGSLHGADWFRMRSQALGNTGVDPRWPEGDHVQVIEPWTPPDAFTGLTNFRANEILTAINQGMDPEPGRDPIRYRLAQHHKSVTSWAGLVIREHFKGTDHEKSASQAQQILDLWVEAGFLTERSYRDPLQRKDRMGLFVTGRPGVVD